MKFLVLLFFITSPLYAKVLLEGRGISMTKTHLLPGEKLKNIKKFRTTVCVGPFEKMGVGAADYLVSFVQQKLKADFIRNFILTEEVKHPFKACYTLEGTASRIVQDKKSLAPKMP